MKVIHGILQFHGQGGYRTIIRDAYGELYRSPRFASSANAKHSAAIWAWDNFGKVIIKWSILRLDEPLLP